MPTPRKPSTSKKTATASSYFGGPQVLGNQRAWGIPVSNIRVTETKFDFKKGPATFSIKARSGVANRMSERPQFKTDPKTGQ